MGASTEIALGLYELMQQLYFEKREKTTVKEKQLLNRVCGRGQVPVTG